MNQKFSKLYKIIKRLDDDKVSVYAAQTSFFLIISSVPLIMLMVTLLRYILIVDRETLYNFILNILPADNEIFSFIDSILDEVLRRTDFSIISISAVTLLWSASRGFRSIAKAIRTIYRSKEGANFIKNTLFSLFYTIVFILIFTFSIALMFFGRFFHTPEILFFIVLILVFALAYKGMARHEMKFKYHMIGAVFSVLGWMVFSFLYSIYIYRYFDNFYSYIYGSLTAIILMMLWLYMCIIILFIGAEINVWFYYKSKNTLDNKPKIR